MDAYQLWQTALGRLQLQLDRPTFDTWVKGTRAITLEDGVLVVSVHSAYAKDWLENRLYGIIQRILSEIARQTITVRFVVQRNPMLETAREEEPLLEEEWGLELKASTPGSYSLFHQG
ncbi:MAG: hypothetical protein H5T66_04790 [Chloroflexi bacterium]|nr:hypothetical protein [Chloroflexota bacterium]